MDFGDFGLREVIWLALAAAAVYLTVSLLRLVRPARQPPAVPATGIPDLTFIAALREEINAERQPRPISPFYGEAMDLAARGYDARGIADECGISVAEAELLLAMSRRRKMPEKGESDDGIWRGRAISGR